MAKTYAQYRADAYQDLPARDLGCVEALDGAAAQLWAADGPRQEGDRPHENSEFVWRDGHLDIDELGADSEQYYAAEAAVAAAQEAVCGLADEDSQQQEPAEDSAADAAAGSY